MIYFKSFRSRNVYDGQRVLVHRNLNRVLSSNNPVYSIQNVDKLVIGHTECVLLTESSFKVYPAGRQRVLETGRKNVHAYIIGNYNIFQYEDMIQKIDSEEKILYDPYLHETFINEVTGKRVDNADQVVIGPNGVYCI